MPRKPRKPSSLCIHHVILRGVNQQIIFEDTNDYLQFINILKYYKKICNFKLYAYCLMNNHIHLLLEHTTTDLDIIMKKIEVKFVRYYSSSRLPDTEALKIIHQKTTCNSPSDFQCLELPIRNHYLHLLYHSGISIRQLSRLTGISRTVISNAVKYNVT